MRQKAEAPVEGERFPPHDGRAVAHVEGQQIVFLRVESDQIPAGECSLEVLQQHRVLAYGVDSHPGDRLRLEADAVTPAENLRMRHRLEVAVHQQPPVRAYRQAGICEKSRRLNAHCHKEEVTRPGRARGRAHRARLGGFDLLALDKANPQADKPAHRLAPHRRIETRQQPLPGDQSDLRRSGGILHQPAQVGGDLQAGRPAAGDHDKKLSLLERGDDPVAGVEQLFNGLDRNHRLVGRHPAIDRHAAAGVEGGDVVRDLIPPLPVQFFFYGIHPGHHVLDEIRPAGERHVLYVETNFLGPVDAGEHAGAHAGVIVMRTGADHGDAMAGRSEVGQLFQDRHVGMSCAHEDQVFRHGKNRSRLGVWIFGFGWVFGCLAALNGKTPKYPDT